MHDEPPRPGIGEAPSTQKAPHIPEGRGGPGERDTGPAADPPPPQPPGPTPSNRRPTGHRWQQPPYPPGPQPEPQPNERTNTTLPQPEPPPDRAVTPRAGSPNLTGDGTETHKTEILLKQFLWPQYRGSPNVLSLFPSNTNGTFDHVSFRANSASVCCSASHLRSQSHRQSALFM